MSIDDTEPAFSVDAKVRPDVSSGAEDEKGSPKTELDAPIWAVVSFEKLERSGLTYAEACTTLETLFEGGISGLCLITTEAAARLKN